MTFSHIPSIIVHGGAWAIPDDAKQACRRGVESAAQVAHAILISGGSALDAVETAIRRLEDDAVFDAGIGSCLTAGGGVEMDAAVMTDGVEGPQSGAVAGVSAARHPISVARKVMEKTPHCFLVGAGAERFVEEIGGERAEKGELVTEGMVEEWKRFDRYGSAVEELFNGGHDTVGAVARDARGRMAVGTSTGGITYKRVGRVGDSPIVGAGLVCEWGVGGVSTTGHGESILKIGLARLVTALMEMRGMGGKEAVREALHRMRTRTGGCGGVILLDAEGEYVWDFTTNRMAWAAVGKDGVLKSGVDRGD